MKALEEAGGVDDTLPGGDDIDLSIRLRDAGYALVVRKDIFVWHHGFQTGERLNGTSDKPGGWNSQEMSDNTNMALIKKHGLQKWMNTMYPWMASETQLKADELIDADQEGKLCKEYIKGKVIADIGCGAKKTVPEAVGIDQIPKDEEIPNIYEKSQADVVADITKTLPFDDNYFDTIISRHSLEHCVDIISTLKHWIRVLKPGGRLIIAVPDESAEVTINLNPEHVHVFTPESLQVVLSLLGLKKVTVLVGYNTSSFLAVYEKESK